MEDHIITWLKEAAGLGEECLPDIPAELMPALRALWQRDRVCQQELSVVRAQLAFYKEAINAQPNPIFIKDDRLRFIFFNRRYQEFFGMDSLQNLGKQVTDLEYLSDEERERYQKEDSGLVEDQTAIQYETVFRSAEKGHCETLYWSKGFLVPDTGQRGVVGEIVDISKEKKLQRDLTRHMGVLEQVMEEVRHTSKLDPGTKLYNRQILTDEIPALMEDAAERGYPVCGLLTDLDNFKGINDTYGHLVGDDVLAKFAQVMRSSLRHGDITIRYGGDEFAAILPGASLAQAREAAERFRDAVRREILLPDGRSVTISVGVTEHKPGEDMMSFFTRTDEALYSAKRSGKNRVVAVPY